VDPSGDRACASVHVSPCVFFRFHHVVLVHEILSKFRLSFSQHVEFALLGVNTSFCCTTRSTQRRIIIHVLSRMLCVGHTPKICQSERHLTLRSARILLL
jgi:hypothetical protein